MLRDGSQAGVRTLHGIIRGDEGQVARKHEVEARAGCEVRLELELAVEAKKYLLSSLKGVRAFRAQAIGVGRSLGLSEADIEEVLGPAS